MTITYRRIRHAAHYGAPGTGHDLEEWDVVDDGSIYRSMRTGHPLPPPGVPIVAEFHSGHVKDGVQHWLFTRRAPLSEGGCPRCAA